MLKETLKKLKELFNDFGYGPYSPRPEVQEILEQKGYKFEPALIPLPHAGNIYYIFTADGEPLNDHDAREDYLKDYEEAEQQYKAAQNSREKSNDKDKSDPKPPEPK